MQPDLIPGMTLGVPRAIAGVLWLRTTTQIGAWYRERRLTERRGRYLAAQMDAIVRLDPYSLPPFEYATNILPAFFGAVTEAHVIALRYLDARPHDWRPYFQIGILYYQHYGQPFRAAEWWRLAALLPGAPYYLPNLAQMARLRATGEIDEQLLQHVRQAQLMPELQEEWDAILEFDRLRRSLRAGLVRFYRRHGRWPHSVDEVVAAGIWSGPPRDPWGGVVRLRDDGKDLLPSDRVPLYFVLKGASLRPDPLLERGLVPDRWAYAARQQFR